MLNFHSKKYLPPTRGRYWVTYLKDQSRDSETGLIQSTYTDCGYAYFDGEKWDRQDWEYWYGQRNDVAENIKGTVSHV